VRRLALAALALALAGVVAAPARPARAQPAPVTIIAVGDMSPEPAAQKTDDMATAAIGIGANPARFLLLGDLQYENGTIAKYRDVRGYVASWGRPQIYGRSVPAYGNHELMDTAPVPAGTPSAAGYFEFFRPRIAAMAETGDPAQGYYRTTIGAWRVYVLATDCRNQDGTGPSCALGSPQQLWLAADMLTAPRCTMAIGHQGRWGSGFFADDPDIDPLWGTFRNRGGDVWLGGHEHHYARFGSLDRNGNLVSTSPGTRVFVVGTGGRSLLGSRIPPHQGLRFRDFNHYGVLRMTLNATGWSSEFRRTDGVIADSVAAACV
jgi:hypothetical protein